MLCGCVYVVCWVYAGPLPATLERFTSRTSGTLLTLGQGDMGQLGLGEDIMERRRPAVVKELDGISIRQVACGGMHTVALTTEGKVSQCYMSLYISLYLLNSLLPGVAATVLCSHVA